MPHNGIMASIKFPEGTTYRVPITLNNEAGTPIDLNGAQVKFAVYPVGSSFKGVVIPFLYKTLGSGIILVDALTGGIRIEFSPSETIDKAGTYDWEMELDEANGDIWQAGTGKLIISPARRLDASD